jgi:DNA-binding protein Fis
MLEQNIESDLFDIMCSSSRKTSQQKNIRENLEELREKYKTKDLNDDDYNNDKT